jgi:hypothetical protein
LFERPGLATAGVVADGLGLVPDVVVEDEVDEGAEVLAVVADTASAEETAGPMVKKLFGSWQHFPEFWLSQQNEVVVELQGSTSGKASRAMFSQCYKDSNSLSKTSYL